MSDKSDGLATAVDGLMRDNPPAPGEDVEQLPLLPLDAPAGQVDGGKPLPAIPTGPGRPKGATNLSTRAWSEFILNNYNSPLVFLAQTVNTSVNDLAERLKCDKLEAFKAQLVAAGKLSEYIHQKQPVAESQEQEPVVLQIAVSPETAEMIRAAGAARQGNTIDLGATVADDDNATESKG